MYELKGGTARLVAALSHARNDQERIKRLSDLLNYLPDQLQQDIDAANDFFDTFRDDNPPQPGK